jgi:hypothetical protein
VLDKVVDSPQAALHFGCHTLQEHQVQHNQEEQHQEHKYSAHRSRWAHHIYWWPQVFQLVEQRLQEVHIPRPEQKAVADKEPSRMAHALSFELQLEAANWHHVVEMTPVAVLNLGLQTPLIGQKRRPQSF